MCFVRHCLVRDNATSSAKCTPAPRSRGQVIKRATMTRPHGITFKYREKKYRTQKLETCCYCLKSYFYLSNLSPTRRKSSRTGYMRENTLKPPNFYRGRSTTKAHTEIANTYTSASKLRKTSHIFHEDIALPHPQNRITLTKGE